MPLKRAGNGEPLRFVRDATKDPGDECMVYPFKLDADGYGRVTFNGKLVKAHRVALAFYEGVGLPEEDVLCIHGSCNNRACCNPKHLSWGNNLKNQQDRKRDGTTSLGARNGNSKLAPIDVIAIRIDARFNKTIAPEYGVDASTIARIKKRKIWNWL